MSLPANVSELVADRTVETAGGLILSGARVKLRLAQAPRRYLCSGWQSWSLTSWMSASSPPPPLRPAVLHPLHTDPRHARLAHHHGSFYGAVENLDGSVLFLGALDLDAHVELRDQTLIGSYERGGGDWFCAVGEEQRILAFYATMLGERLGHGRIASAPRVWCSWYSLYTKIFESQLLEILQSQRELPFDVFQIDDGWQKDIGDWQPNRKFPSGMAALADRIKAAGRTAGLWLAPLVVVPSSSLYREHADWLLRDERGAPVSAGINWSQPLYALDTTRPAVLDWLAALMKRVRGWGYDYVKLDFLYAGALPGVRHRELPREAAYRQGLQTLRDALTDAYLLTCGAPILPSLGLCDGLRIGPDVAGHFESTLESRYLHNFATPGVRNALRTCLHRLWLRPLCHTDPDVAYFSRTRNQLSDEERALLQDLAHIAGFRATSELPHHLDATERKALHAFLRAAPRIETIAGPLAGPAFRIDGRPVDYRHAVALPPPPTPLQQLCGRLVGALASRPSVMRAYQALAQALG